MIGSRVNDLTIEAAWEMTLLARLPIATEAALAMMLNRVPTFSAATPRDSRSMFLTAELIWFRPLAEMFLLRPSSSWRRPSRDDLIPLRNWSALNLSETIRSSILAILHRPPDAIGDLVH